MALSRERIVATALRLVDRNGLDAVTLRALAAELGVQAPTLYWHIRDKAELLDALADAIMAEVVKDPPETDADGAWEEWLLAAMARLRRTLLSHPDSARVVSGARDSFGRAEFSERAMAELVARGVDLQRARLTVLVAERFTVGYVLEEQASHRDAPGPDVAEITRRLPTVTRAITEYFSSGRTPDDLYLDGLRLVVGGGADASPAA